MGVSKISGEARGIVERERAAVATRVEDLKRQSEALHTLVEGVDGQLVDAARLLRQMDEMLGSAPQISLEILSEELRGQRLREVAVEVLRHRRGEGETIHYKEWFALLEAEGLRIGGKNALATFLTQIAEAPQVESVRPRSGLYRLRAV